MICLILAASAAVPPFTYRLPSPIFKTYATTNPHGKSPSSLSPETSTLELFVESFDEATFENPTDFTEKTASETSGDDSTRKTELAYENATNLSFVSFGLFSE